MRQGTALGVQSIVNNNLWLSCSGSVCTTSACPGLILTCGEFKGCWGEVFVVYREKGEGPIEVGNRVGFYYPQERNWFSLWGGKGHKNPCPGAPTNSHGFENADKWNNCVGEVFTIRAFNKVVGEDITSDDLIQIYYPQGKKYVRMNVEENKVGFGSCPRPPHPHPFESCTSETFRMSLIFGRNINC